MGRELKRVPMDFEWPLKKVWWGYQHFSGCGDDCDECRLFAKIKGQILSENQCPHYPEIEALKEPPKGEGYQLWETTSEGSPSSPVFASLDELCEWCEENATTFADFKATKEEWKQMLNDDFVFHKQGNVIFI